MTYRLKPRIVTLSHLWASWNLIEHAQSGWAVHLVVMGLPILIVGLTVYPGLAHIPLRTAQVALGITEVYGQCPQQFGQSGQSGQRPTHCGQCRGTWPVPTTWWALPRDIGSAHIMPGTALEYGQCPPRYPRIWAVPSAQNRVGTS